MFVNLERMCVYLLTAVAHVWERNPSPNKDRYFLQNSKRLAQLSTLNHMRAQILKYELVRTHAHTHTHAHLRTLTHTHTHTHTHKNGFRTWLARFAYIFFLIHTCAKMQIDTALCRLADWFASTCLWASGTLNRKR